MAKEKAKHDGLLCFLLALIVVLILVICGGGYYFLVVDNEEEITQNKTSNVEQENNNNTINKEQSEETNIKKIIGDWRPYSARENGEEIDLKLIYGSSLSMGGYLTFNTDGTYSEFINAYSEEIEDTLQGTYTIVNNNINILTKSGINKKMKYNEQTGEIISEKEGNITVIFKKVNKGIAELKTALTNYEWVKENLYMHRNVFGEKVFGDEEQYVSFEIINKANNNPIIVTLAEGAGSKQISIVRYQDNKVTVENWEPAHASHCGFEINNDILVANYAHMGTWEYHVYKISNDSTKKIEENSGSIGEKEDYTELQKIKNKYSTKLFEKELNSVNIVKYLKETIN